MPERLGVRVLDRRRIGGALGEQGEDRFTQCAGADELVPGGIGVGVGEDQECLRLLGGQAPGPRHPVDQVGVGRRG